MAMNGAVDVAIIGAGPAGSTAATLLARRGLDVALIDRDSFPRDKLCGEFLSYDAFPVLDLLGLGDFPRRIAAPEISTCRLFAGSHSREFPLPRAALGVSRMALDAELVSAAERAGANVFRDTTVTAVDHDRRVVHCSSGEQTFAFTPRIIIGAWGRWGRLDRALGRSFVTDRAHRHFGFKRHYAGIPMSSDAIELHSFDRGYLGVSAIEGGLVNICGLVHESRLSQLKGRWEHFTELLGNENATLGERFLSGTPASEFLSSEPVIFSGKQPVAGEMLLAGDAAGLLDPLTGNGMAMAMQSGVLVSTYLPDALSTSKSGEYEDAYRSLFSRRLEWSRRVAFVLSRPAVVRAALMFLPARASGRLLVRKTRASDRQLQKLIASALSV